MSNKERFLSNGPSIQVQFSIQNGLISRVRLFPSSESGFQWTIEGQDPVLEAQIEGWLNRYVNHDSNRLDLPLDRFHVSTFTEVVLSVIQTIPFGAVSTYGKLASVLQRPQSARAVGRACGQNPFPLLIPCHRVLDSTFALRGFSEGLEIKKSLLEFENSFTHIYKI